MSSELANGKLAAPNGNTLYAVFAPADSGPPSAGGYHGAFIDPSSGKVIYYMVMFADGGVESTPTDPELGVFLGLTTATSHELSESITDPGAGDGWASSTFGEIGDVSEGTDLVTYHGYVMQEEWGRSPTDPPNLALGPVVAPSDTDFAVTQINDPTAGIFNGVFATFTDKDGASESPSQFNVTVDWGDGASSRSNDGSGDVTVTSNGDGTFNVVGRHIYVDPAGTTLGGHSLGYFGAAVLVSSGDEIALTTTPITLQAGGGALPPQQMVNTTSAALFPGAGLWSLSDAILLANADHSGHANITFDPTVFATPQTITLTGAQLELSNTSETETITGPAAGLTVNGGGLSPVFQVDAGVTASVSGLTITGGNAGFYGGGLLNLGTATLTDYTVSGNSASVYGGGLASLGAVALTDCTVSGNSAGNGGGGLANSGTVTLSDCTLDENNASVNGGGLGNLGTATLTDCTVSYNGALYGGGLASSGTATLTNCTVSGNAAGAGGGLFNQGVLSVDNTIVAGNTAAAGGPDAFGMVSSSGNNLVGATDGSTGWVGSDLTGAAAAPLNPLLAPLGNYGGPTQTMPLLPGSPALDAGNNALLPAGLTTDQRGLPRVVHTTVDIGAFESGGFTLAVTSGSGQSTNISTAFSAPLVVTVTANNPGEPVAGGRVIFTPPPSGASAILGGDPATIGATGKASITATADGVAGRYTVSATARGITTPASFSLSNRPTINLPAPRTAYENVDQPITGINLGDAPGATPTVTLNVSHGTLTPRTTTGLTTIAGNGTGTVTLIGTTANLDAALNTLVYRGGHNYSGGDTLRLTATDSGVSATPASVAIAVASIAQEATSLQAQVIALRNGGMLSPLQALGLDVWLTPDANVLDTVRVEGFLLAVELYRQLGILSPAQAAALLAPGDILLLGVTRR